MRRPFLFSCIGGGARIMTLKTPGEPEVLSARGAVARLCIAMLILGSVGCQCGFSPVTEGETGGGGATGGGATGGGATGGGATGGGAAGGGSTNCDHSMDPPGALRGCSGCSTPRPTCQAGEYVISVGCFLGGDGGFEPVNNISGAWCFALPQGSPDPVTCSYLINNGAFGEYGVGFNPAAQVQCPGSYWWCGSPNSFQPVFELHCNPP